MPALLRCLLAASFLVLSACDAPPRFDHVEPGEATPGGQTSVSRFDRAAFSQPAANLSHARRLDFAVGNSFFRSPWVIAPATTTARDGLGPLFNTNACINCHIRDGRGHPAQTDARNAVSMLVRLSLPERFGTPDELAHHGVVAEPVYGTQLQDMAIPGVTPEAKIRVRYTAKPVTLGDGSVVELRQPHLTISDLGYGALHPDTLFSVRVAPPMIGLGLLEAIDEADILANADPEDADGDGIAGRPNWVWDRATQRPTLGRFGWKAGQPSLNQQNADAFANDLGLTSSLIPQDNCTDAQQSCRQAPHGGEPEVSDHLLAAVSFYTRTLAVPQRRVVDRAEVLAGKQLFHEVGCARCHTPRFTTSPRAAEPELAGQVIYPYSDLLLHDMGEALADGRSEFAASGRHWRTAPLWGLGLTEAVSGHTQLLHDGRARNVLEAILWHGGEAQSARDRVIELTAPQRQALLAFLHSL